MNFTYHQPLLPAALHLHRLGVCVIPLRPGTKMPAMKWKRFQFERPDEETLRSWFADKDTGNHSLGVVLGQVSGGLLVRDFDERTSYEAWRRSKPTLAAALPTVMAARGPHVWFRCEGYLPPEARSFVRKFKDGELRGDAHIVVVPPSIHGRTGQSYRWINEPKGQIPTVDLLTFGYQPSGHVTQAISVLHSVPQRESSSSSTTTNLCVTSPLESPKGRVLGLARIDRPHLTVADAIRRTLPTGPGERHRQIFEFARCLKAIPELASLDHARLEQHVRQWHAQAQCAISTKDFKETWIDFQNAWVRVRLPAGCGSLAAAWERALSSELPPEAKQFEKPKIRLLVSICRELQRERGDEPFYLSCRDAAAALGLTGKEPHITAHRWLKMLCHVEILKAGKSGSMKERKANEYRYVGFAVAPPLPREMLKQRAGGEAKLLGDVMKSITRHLGIEHERPK